jgi:hypothetical protein
VKRRVAAGVVVAGLGAAWLAVDRSADALFDDPRAAVPWADAVAEAVAGGLAPRDPADQFGGEQDAITCALAILGLGQVAGDDPALRARYREPVRTCARFLDSAAARGFGARRWGEDPLLAEVPLDHGHAWLGWNAVGVAEAARLTGDPDLVDASHCAADLLAARLPLGPASLETYPGEVYPTDQAAVVAAIAVDGRHEDEVRAFLDRWEAAAIDPATGLQYQALVPGSGRPADGVRGSGSAISAWFLVRSDPALARRLADAVDRELRRSVLGVGGVMETPPGAPFRMDIDSGPVVPGLRFGVAATGFGLADARIAGDRGWYRTCWRSAMAFGLPAPRWFAAGGTIGNAVLLAAATGGER